MYSVTYNEFLKRVKNARGKHPHKVMAGVIGVARSVYTRKEQGHIPFTVPEVLMMADFLKYPPLLFFVMPENHVDNITQFVIELTDTDKELILNLVRRYSRSTIDAIPGGMSGSGHRGRKNSGPVQGPEQEGPGVSNKDRNKNSGNSTP